MLFNINLFAHGPKDITVDYNDETGKLQLTIEHPVNNTSSHYIDEIELEIDGEEVKTITYESQTDKKNHIVEIDLPEFKDGGELEIIAKCNRIGREKITIER